MSSTLGGMERRMEAEGLFLKSIGHEVFVATPAFPGCTEWAKHLEELGLKHIVWGPYKVFERMHLGWPFVIFANSTVRRILALEIDFALICVPWNFVGMTMAHILSRGGIRFALAIHSLLSDQKLKDNAIRMLRLALKSCVSVYGVSDPVTKSFRSLYGQFLPARCVVTTISNGIDTDRFCLDRVDRHAVRESLGVSPEQKVIVFCGRLDAAKRPCLAVEAFCLLAKRDSTIKLLVVGSGIEEAAMKTVLDRMGLLPRAIFVGHVSDTSYYFAAGDCYLSTSEREGSPLTAAEAASSGLSLILPGDEVHRAIYAECFSATFCSSSIPSDWAAKIETALDKRMAAPQQLTGESRSFAVDRLSLTKMEASLSSFYGRVLGDA